MLSAVSDGVNVCGTVLCMCAVRYYTVYCVCCTVRCMCAVLNSTVYVHCVLCMNSTAVSMCVLCVLTDCVSGSRSLDLEQSHSIRVITRYHSNSHHDI